jgi:hypothetical protein
MQIKVGVRQWDDYVQDGKVCTEARTKLFFAYITSLWVEEKRTYILCKSKTLPT